MEQQEGKKKMTEFIFWDDLSTDFKRAQKTIDKILRILITVFQYWMKKLKKYLFIILS